MHSHGNHFYELNCYEFSEQRTEHHFFQKEAGWGGREFLQGCEFVASRLMQTGKIPSRWTGVCWWVSPKIWVRAPTSSSLLITRGLFYWDKTLCCRRTTTLKKAIKQLHAPLWRKCNCHWLKYGKYVLIGTSPICTFWINWKEVLRMLAIYWSSSYSQSDCRSNILNLPHSSEVKGKSFFFTAPPHCLQSEKAHQFPEYLPRINSAFGPKFDLLAL